MRVARWVGVVVGVAACGTRGGGEARSGAGSGTATATATAPANDVQVPAGRTGIADVSRHDVCGRTIQKSGKARDGIKPFEREDGSCGVEGMCDVAEVPPKGGDRCFVATSNIRRAERDSGAGGARAQSRAWDAKSAPTYFDRVDAHRLTLGAADVGFVLGHDRAKGYLAEELANHPTLGAALTASRAQLAAGARGKNDVYSAWIGAALHLADRPMGSVPSFMRTDAYADLRMGSALAVYAQIRHTFVLLAGQGYDAYGCEIPDGWVEPAVPVYDGMLAWSRAAARAAPSQAAYFRRVDQVLGMLRSISMTELSGAALSEPQRRWLGMISEYTPKDGYGGDSGEPPKYTGWYFDLFPDREIGAERPVDLVADWFTLTNAAEVAHLGVANAALGVFVVDVGGEPRAMVGPVAKTYEVATRIDGRLDDERARTAPGKHAAWLSSFLAPAVEAPPVAARLFVCDDDARVVVSATRPMSATITLLDHHGDPLGEAQSTSGDLTREPAVLAFALPRAILGARRGIEGRHVRVDAPGRWDHVTGVSVYRADATALTLPDSPFAIAFGAAVPPPPLPTSSSPSR
jgi:hypothetical protein